MKIVELHFYTGRNVYSHRPVMKMLVDLGIYRSFRTDRDSGINERLLAILPGLAEHHCSRRRPGGFVERLREGTYPGHVIEHVFLELQNMAGIGTDYGKTMTAAAGLTEIICEFRCREAAEILAPAAMKLVQAVIERQAFALAPFLAEAKRAAAEFMPGPSTAAILAAARKRQIPVQQLEEGTSLYRLGSGKYQRRIMASITDGTGCIAADIAGNKPLTKKILSLHGLPVPKGEVVRSREEARQAAQRIGFPVAMKPDNGNQGKGVSLNLACEQDVEKAYLHAVVFSPSVMVESYLHGRHYRMLIIKGELVAAAERIPAHVIGDGIHTVNQLIQWENKNPLRGLGHEKPLTQLPLDEVTDEVLARQGFFRDTVPGTGRRVFLRDNANLSTGGIARDVTDAVHPLQAEMAALAAKLIGLDIAGVDLVMEDISLPPQGQDGGIIEVNAAPGLRMHLHPTEGTERDVGKKVVDTLYPPGAPVRVPVFSVTGTNGKTTTTRMLEYAMRRHGLVTGMCCTDGVYHNGKLVKKGDLTGPAGAFAVLNHPDTEVAVLETARGGILRRGLGYDRADIAVICNIRADHLGQDGIETLDDLIHVKSLVVEAVYSAGTVVLNADEPHVNQLAERVHAEIICFSMQPDSLTVRRHLGKGGRAVFIRRGALLAAHGSRVTLVGRIRDFAITLGGRAAHQVENLLAAIAACWGFGLTPRQAGFYLRTFASTIEDNPGRANLYQINGVQILVDYGHNPDGFLRIGELAKKLKPVKKLAVVGVPGDRCDELVRAAGKAAAKCFDFLYVKEDEDLRGRTPGEVASLLVKGALSAGKNPSRIEVCGNEKEAVQKAISAAAPGDLVVVFYENLELVLGEIEARKQEPSLSSRADAAKPCENRGSSAVLS